MNAGYSMTKEKSANFEHRKKRNYITVLTDSGMIIPPCKHRYNEIAAALEVKQTVSSNLLDNTKQSYGFFNTLRIER
jgi:hypothetical protein